MAIYAIIGQPSANSGKLPLAVETAYPTANLTSPPGESTPPKDFPQVPPRDLHPTSDIRFVIVEVTKLSTLVERLISDVKDQDKKLDDLRGQATYIKGGLAMLAVVIGVAGWIISTALDGKWAAVMKALAVPHST
jgi:hypothetical protein